MRGCGRGRPWRHALVPNPRPKFSVTTQIRGSQRDTMYCTSNVIICTRTTYFVMQASVHYIRANTLLAAV